MVWLRPRRSVCIREDSDSDPIGGFGLRFGEDQTISGKSAGTTERGGGERGGGGGRLQEV